MNKDEKIIDTKNNNDCIKDLSASNYQSIGAKYSKVGSGAKESLFSITNATSSKISLSSKILDEKLKCKEGDSIEFLFGEDDLLIIKSDIEAIRLCLAKNKYIIYNKELVRKITDVLKLDFTVRTSYSVYEYELVQYKGKTALNVKKNDFNV